MPTMRAIQISAPGAEFELVNREIPEPKEGEVLIKVQACGVCHGEAVIKGGHFQGLTYPRIPGHEVMGIIDKLGPNVNEWQIGQRIGVGWHGGHCFKCPACRRGDFLACNNSLTTGITVDGGYAEYMIARSEVLVSIPEELDTYEGAPLLCAGRTVFGALKYSDARGGDLVAIHGIGGLGHLALQYSLKLGFKTVALSRGTDKKDLSIKLGAHAYFDTSTGDAAKKLLEMGGARVILCTAPNSHAIIELIDGLGRNGQIIIVAAPQEMMQFHPGLLMKGSRSIGAWVSGNIEDAINFSLLSHVIPMVEFFPLEQAAVAFEKMMTAKVRFRAVLKIS
jgi:D-arabinose 1-dehydrogenase-like Zn-dependent alcohol dehydrogenase